MMLPRASTYLNPALRSRVYVTVGCPSVHPSVWLSRRSTAAAACGWFAAERARAADVDVCTSFRLIYCILFRKFLISKINVALQLLKLWLKKVTTATTVDRQLRAPRTGYGSTSAAGAGAQQHMRVESRGMNMLFYAFNLRPHYALRVVRLFLCPSFRAFDWNRSDKYIVFFTVN